MSTDLSTVPTPSFKKGWEIFASRPLSLITLLILAVSLSVISFFILFLPVTASFYYTISRSKRERYFIDLYTIIRTVSIFFNGIKHYFLQSYLFGMTGLISPILLLLVPVFIVEFIDEKLIYLSFILQILFLPAFFLFGSVILYGYPKLIHSHDALLSLRYSFHSGKCKPLLVSGLGFMILCPIPGFIFHLLMVFSYPILIASAMASTADLENDLLHIPIRWKLETTWKGFYFLLPLFFIFGLYCSFQIWAGPGIVGWIGLSFAFFIATKMTSFGFAIKLFGFVFGFIGILFGGMIFLARQWNETVGMIWVIFCILILLIFQRKLATVFKTDTSNETMENADQFIELASGREQKKRSMTVGCIGLFVSFISLLVFVGTMGKTIGGILWIGFILLFPFILAYFSKEKQRQD